MIHWKVGPTNEPEAGRSERPPMKKSTSSTDVYNDLNLSTIYTNIKLLIVIQSNVMCMCMFYLFRNVIEKIVKIIGV